MASHWNPTETAWLDDCTSWDRTDSFLLFWLFTQFRQKWAKKVVLQKIETDTQRGEYHVRPQRVTGRGHTTMEVEIRMIPLYAKECQDWQRHQKLERHVRWIHRWSPKKESTQLTL